MITDLRLNADEMRDVAAEIARRLAYTKDKAYFIIPTAGYDSYGVEGEGFHDPEADAAFVEVLEKNLPGNIEVLRRNTHVDDPEFAREAAELLISLIRAKS